MPNTALLSTIICRKSFLTVRCCLRFVKSVKSSWISETRKRQCRNLLKNDFRSFIMSHVETINTYPLVALHALSVRREAKTMNTYLLISLVHSSFSVFLYLSSPSFCAAMFFIERYQRVKSQQNKELQLVTYPAGILVFWMNLICSPSDLSLLVW